MYIFRNHCLQNFYYKENRIWGTNLPHKISKQIFYSINPISHLMSYCQQKTTYTTRVYSYGNIRPIKSDWSKRNILWGHGLSFMNFWKCSLSDLMTITCLQLFTWVSKIKWYKHSMVQAYFHKLGWVFFMKKAFLT